MISESPGLTRAGLSDLARAAAAGDTAATARLLRAVAPEMLRVVRGVMGPYASDVDDAMQQSLVAFIHALPAFRGDCPAAGYACRIAFRTALSVRRSAKKNLSHCDQAADTDAFAGPDCPNASTEAAQRMELLRSMLDELPTEQAETLTMRTMLGWALEEIAQVSGVPLNTVRSRLRLAKEAMRRKIEANPSLLEELGVRS